MVAHLVKSQTELSEKNRWGTTWECFQDAEKLFGTEFQIDVAAEKETAKCSFFYGPVGYNPDVKTPPRCLGLDSINEHSDWGDSWWCNPPFDLKQEFLRVAAENCERGHSGMMLIPYEPCTQWFRKLVIPFASVIYVPDGRYNFLHTDGQTKKSGVNFPSCFVLFTPHHNGGEAKIVNFKRGLIND